MHINIQSKTRSLRDLIISEPDCSAVTCRCDGCDLLWAFSYLLCLLLFMYCHRSFGLSSFPPAASSLGGLILCPLLQPGGPWLTTVFLPVPEHDDRLVLVVPRDFKLQLSSGVLILRILARIQMSVIVPNCSAV